MGGCEAINSELRRRLPLDDVRVCPHDDSDHCDCRKPAPGLLVDGASAWNIDLAQSVMVGDRWRDVEAGKRAGCAVVLINHDYAEKSAFADADLVVASFPRGHPVDPESHQAGYRLVTSMNDLRIKIFADGADEKGIAELAANPLIKGFTTNPTLMRAAGVSDYVAFAHRVLQVVTEAPISFEVFADEWDEMERQARKITTWGKNVFVKIPITNTKGESAGDLMHRLADDGIRLNVTALLTVDQVRTSTKALAGGPECIISVFAGRVADTGVDPDAPMCECPRRDPGAHRTWS